MSVAEETSAAAVVIVEAADELAELHADLDA